MRENTIKYWNNYLKDYLSSGAFWRTTGFSVLLLLLSLVINYFAGTYATRYESNPVTDIVLSNIPVFNLDETFIYGTVLFVIFIVFLCFTNPKITPFVVKSIALFVVIRSGFIIMTHIAPYPTAMIINPASFITKFTFGGDLFFSGHTGLPFLMTLVFWKNKLLRYIFLATSIFFAVVVLLTHLHYSIDVMAAFFITFTIYHIAKFFFKKDEQFFNEGFPLKNI